MPQAYPDLQSNASILDLGRPLALIFLNAEFSAFKVRNADIAPCCTVKILNRRHHKKTSFGRAAKRNVFRAGLHRFAVKYTYIDA
ncbi:MAG: hypothetical protein LBU32_13365 [Clostridiales bacterium]|jgi:hypothetical protein|nr:hypothetical protein [Clostridiales bacterium]